VLSADVLSQLLLVLNAHSQLGLLLTPPTSDGSFSSRQPALAKYDIWMVAPHLAYLWWRGGIQNARLRVLLDELLATHMAALVRLHYDNTLQLLLDFNVTTVMQELAQLPRHFYVSAVVQLSIPHLLVCAVDAYSDCCGSVRQRQIAATQDLPSAACVSSTGTQSSSSCGNNVQR
jgi:hypothetical protein